MKKHLKWIIPVICVVLAVSAVGGYMYWSGHHIPKEMPTEISYIHSDTDIDLNNPCEVVGVKEYVFVGYVEETYDYYMTKNSHKFPKLIEDYDMACTECVVKVVKNIKGELKEGESFSFYKMGGVSKNREYIELYENDLLPEVGKYYVFSGLAHSDGVMTGGGQNGTIELENGITEANITESEIYNLYVDAYARQILPENKGFYPDYLSVIDVNYGDGSYNRTLEKGYLEKQAEIDAKYEAQKNEAK